MTRWSSATLASLALLTTTAPAPCRETGTPPTCHRFEKPCMGTLFAVVIYSERPAAEVESAAAAALEVAAQLEGKLSDYRADSEVGIFNHSPPEQSLTLSPTLAELLGRAADLSRETGGAFDPARGALTRLWRLSRRSGKLPEPATLAQAQRASGIDSITIDTGAATIARHSPLTRLDLGGIAKGFAADRMLALLRARGFPRSSVAAGGDVATGSAPPGRAGWKIAIRTRGDLGDPEPHVVIANAAVSTSGDVEQAVEIDGQRYSHLIDPETGLGMRARRAATVIAPSATESDALATALCLLGAEGLAHIEKRPNTEAAVFSISAAGDSERAASTGFNAFSKQ